MNEYSLVAENPESTVVARYEAQKHEESKYQSEAALEKAFIEQLQSQAYQYLNITTEAELIKNLRAQLEKLNHYQFTDGEWKQLFTGTLAKADAGIVEKTRLIQEDNVQVLHCDDGTVRNITLLDKRNIHNNSLQVINQYTPQGGKHENRYDVTILVNGLPLVHVELKRRGVDIRQAFNQINRYQRESFWSGSGLYEYIQVFVISNGTFTKYYSNTTRSSHIREMESASQKQTKKTSNSFEFTSWWADEQNLPITDLMDFTRTFFAKHTLLNVLAKYCILTTDQILLVMRPYQIVATEKILNRILVAHNYHREGSLEAGGYIWHTTGSGKTLTSFKTAQMATKYEFVDKVVFVVDRKDLDYQTMKEYDKFEKDAANSNTSTAVLRRQLFHSDAKIIITTIQKLSSLLKKKDDPQVNAILQKQIVFIFDECHRSQFGQMHTDIIRRFKKYYIFGFTGTPIFAVNAGTGGNPKLKTTAQAFGEKLHSYTIVDAIRDKNVLPFRVEYISTMKEKEEIENTQVWSIDTDRALEDPRRIRLVTEYIIKHCNQKTKRNDKAYAFHKLMNVTDVATDKQHTTKEKKQAVKLTGFNAILAVASIDYAKMYYQEFKKQNSGLKVATIFSYGVNDDDDPANGVPDENPEDTTQMTQADRDFLDGAIKDYNGMFGTNYDTSSDKFQNYYKDVSLRMKNRDIDLLIVVNMFLTGFDATTLNTLWVDKNLRMHGLIQAYSRTNRILNSIKTFGNIVCFRNLEKATNDAISLFGNKEACGVVLMKTFKEYYEGYEDEKGHHIPGYVELVARLMSRWQPGEIIESELEKKEFVKVFGALLRAQNILTAFDQFTGNEIISERDMQDYRSMYLDIYEWFREQARHEKEVVNDDLVFEMELIKQVEINIDYILELVRKYVKENSVDKMLVLQDIERAVDSSPEMRNKKELIENFIQQVTPSSDIDDDWNTFIHHQMSQEIDQIIHSEGLKEGPARKFIQNSFLNGYVASSGTDIAKIMPPMNPFSKTVNREEKKQSILEKIKAFFDRYYDLVGALVGEDSSAEGGALKKEVPLQGDVQLDASVKYEEPESGALPLAAEE